MKGSVFVDNFKILGNDIIFKNVCYKNPDVLAWILNRTFSDVNFNTRINNFHFLNTELIKGNKYIKSKNVDMLIETDDIVCNIEVNKIFNRKQLFVIMHIKVIV